MNLVRRYKISKILNQPLKGIEGQIINFIKDWLTDLEIRKFDKFPNSIFWLKKNKIVLHQNLKFEFLNVIHENCWEILEKKYNMKYSDIQNILKYMIEESFRNQIKTSTISQNCSILLIKEILKNGVKTPNKSTMNHIAWVEGAFN